MPSRKRKIKTNKISDFRFFTLRRLPIEAIALTLLSLITVFSFLFLMGAKNLALIGTALAMPDGCISYVQDNLLSKREQAEEITQQSIIAPEHFTPQIDEGNEPSQEEKSYDIKKTPPDILSLMAKFKAEHSGDKNDGAIIETTFGTKGSTHHYKNIYVKNVTETKKLDIEKSLNQKVDINIKDKSEPAVLIFHTHTTESYEILDRGFYSNSLGTRSDNASRNVVRVGDEIEKELTKAGYNVIHIKKIHDRKYTGAYDESRKTVSECLKKYPSIQVVLDVHRDAILLDGKTKLKPVTTINGKKAAQVMIITGAEEGLVKNFPDWQENLCFTLNLQKICADMYPTLMRPVLFSQRKYVMDLSHCNVLIEMGSDSNTLEEAAYSGRLIGTALSKMLGNYVSE